MPTKRLLALKIATPAMARILVSIPSRGRPHLLAPLMSKLAETKSPETVVVVVSNGPEPAQVPTVKGIYVVHVGNVPTIPVSVNFGWYALRRPGDILVKLDNDIVPPDNWESEIFKNYEAIDLGGFIISNEIATTNPIVVRGQRARAPHLSESWNIPFIWSGFVWLSPRIADKMLYEDERFVRSDDGEIAERAMRIPDTTVAHCHDSAALHQARLFKESTERYDLMMAMYDACDLLINSLPNRPISQDTVWRLCLTQQDAAQIVLSNGILSTSVTQKVCHLLREKLENAFVPIGKKTLVERIFTES